MKFNKKISNFLNNNILGEFNYHLGILLKIADAYQMFEVLLRESGCKFFGIVSVKF